MMLPIQVQVLTLWVSVRQHLTDAGERMRDERGETTAGVILLVMLAVAAVAIAGIIISKLNSQANKIPG